MKHFYETLSDPDIAWQGEISFFEGGRLITRTGSDFQSEVILLSTWLDSLSLAEGTLIGIFSENTVSWLLWDLATMRCGLRLKAFNKKPQFSILDDFLTEHSLALLIANDPLLIATGALDITVAENPVKIGDEVIIKREECPSFNQDCLSLVYSSGTTGHDKGLIISKKGADFVIKRFIQDYQLSERDRHLIFLPLANFQQRLSVYGCLLSNASLCLCDYKSVFPAMQAFRPTFLIAPPVFYRTVVQVFKMRENKDVTLNALMGGNIRFCITGMAPIDRATVNHYEQGGVRLLEAYGTTETGMITWSTLDSYKPGSTGKPLDRAHLLINADGELSINRPWPLSQGYFDLPDGESTEIFLANGNIVTGDIVTEDEDGFFYIVGRTKEVIILDNGKKIHPSEIEDTFEINGIDCELVVFFYADKRAPAMLVSRNNMSESDFLQCQKKIESVNLSLPQDYKVKYIYYCNEPIKSNPDFMTANMKMSRKKIEDFILHDIR
ncbi:AMP-binding protein [Rahnella aceris]|uniref:AMP-binding protein n=1 Tax=Rahnella sp. (strain Y9602) TaxID=2703885 RepID=A0ABW6CFZ7_RAHSY